MSDVAPPPPGPGEPPRVLPESDRVSSRAVALGLLGTVMVFAIAVWAMSRAMAAAEEQPPAPVPASIGQPTLHEVDQVPFRLDDRRERAARSAAERLTRYGWVDRDAGIAHIPIAEAMRLVADRTRDAGPSTLELRTPTGGVP